MLQIFLLCLGAITGNNLYWSYVDWKLKRQQRKIEKVNRRIDEIVKERSERQG